jgi:hypothetical protein
MVLVTGVQAAGVLAFSGRLRSSLVIAAAVAQLALLSAVAALWLRRRAVLGADYRGPSKSAIGLYWASAPSPP